MNSLNKFGYIQPEGSPLLASTVCTGVYYFKSPGSLTNALEAKTKWVAMEQKRELLIHFLAALAYRTAKALHGAPADFGFFRTLPKSRTPHELIRHMDSVLGYARTFLIGGSYRPPEYEHFQDAVTHFHETLADLAGNLQQGAELHGITEEQLLQGPFSDAMTHAGQLALLRRLAGNPVPPENFVFAKVSTENLGPDQPAPARPDREWPEAPV